MQEISQLQLKIHNLPIVIKIELKANKCIYITTMMTYSNSYIFYLIK